MATQHARHNHDARRYGQANVQAGNSQMTYADTTGTNTTSDTVTIPASLIEHQQAAESQNQEYPVVQEVTPPRPLGL